MGKRGASKGQSKRGRLEYEVSLDTEAAAAYLEQLALGLRQGSVRLDEQGEGFQASVDGSVDMAVRARQGKRKARLEVSLAFRGPGDAKHAGVTDDPPAATIPDEMSF
jgi:amphi-Trp domain-containing protein